MEDEPQVESSSVVGSIKKTTEGETETGVRRKCSGSWRKGNGSRLECPLTTVKKWESICAAWVNNNFPKKKKNPYHTEGIGKSVHTSVSFFILRVIPLGPY